MHDHKGHSEEKCTRCGWVMGHPPLNCQDDNTPHVFPSQLRSGPRPLLHRILDRLFPHDTLRLPDGTPYMHRWYLCGYAPTPDDPDARMICATCKEPLVDVGDADWGAAQPSGQQWQHAMNLADGTRWRDHDPAPISAPREGWRWQDHGMGAARVHCILASDDQRAFHDHPWHFASIGLAGSYTELRPAPDCRAPRDPAGPGALWAHLPDDARTVRRRFRAPFVNVKRATDLHALIVEGGPVWSLFLSRPKLRSWGFATPDGWVPWREFEARAAVEQ